MRIILSIFFLGTIICICSAQEPVLVSADSLFKNQKYTEAFDLYRDLHDQGQSSPAMLLKMAFIKDGLGDYADALYFLDQYYKLSADRSVIAKIEEIAGEQELKGYSYDDRHFFAALVGKYSTYLKMVSLAVILFLFAYIYRKKTAGEKPVTATVLQLFFAGLFLFFVNDFYKADKGIIHSDNTLLRSGPSAGAEPLKMIEKGHKVDVIEQDEAWTKIIWDQEEVFIRNSRVRKI